MEGHQGYFGEDEFECGVEWLWCLEKMGFGACHESLQKGGNKFCVCLVKVH